MQCPSGGDAPQVADEQQMLEVGGDRGEVLKRLDRLLAPFGVARAQGRGEEWFLDDCGSLNGTYVNRRRIESHRLVEGDELQVGKYKLAYLTP